MPWMTSRVNDTHSVPAQPSHKDKMLAVNIFANHWKVFICRCHITFITFHDDDLVNQITLTAEITVSTFVIEQPLDCFDHWGPQDKYQPCINNPPIWSYFLWGRPAGERQLMTQWVVPVEGQTKPPIQNVSIWLNNQPLSPESLTPHSTIKLINGVFRRTIISQLWLTGISIRLESGRRSALQLFSLLHQILGRDEGNQLPGVSECMDERGKISSTVKRRSLSLCRGEAN